LAIFKQVAVETVGKMRRRLRRLCSFWKLNQKRWKPHC